MCLYYDRTCLQIQMYIEPGHSSATCLNMSMHKSLLNQQKDIVQPCPCVWCFAELELGDKCWDSSFHSFIKTGIWRGRVISARSLQSLCYGGACVFPGISGGTSTHLPGAGHVPSSDVCCVSSCQLIWLPWIFAREDRDVPKLCEDLVPLVHSSHDLHQVDMDLLPQMIVRIIKPPSKRTCFQLKFSKSSGCKD